MYYTTLYFRIIAKPETTTMLMLFFQDWADKICPGEVAYTLVAKNDTQLVGPVIKVDCTEIADAIALKLAGVPTEFRDYLEYTN